MIRISDVNIRLIIEIIGRLLMIEGIFMWLCLPFSFYYQSNDHWDIFLGGCIAVFSGSLLWFFTKTSVRSSFGKREAYIIVTLSWLVISIFGAIPFVLNGCIPNYTDAFFETISGFTTTGASILTDIEAMPKGLLFWRSLTHWIGGMGIIVLSLAIIPFLGIGGMQLFAAEAPGPTTEKLHPKITETAKRLWGIYLIFSIVETILLLFGGMNLFDSLCHTFGTMATGGFSTKNSSVSEFSPYIQYVIIVFMFLAGTNFTLHYFGLHLKFKKFWMNEEFRYYFLMVITATIIITLGLALSTSLDWETSFRDSLFQVVSIITTTGFVSSDYLVWPPVLWVIIFLLMFTGGCAGSTGGGIKAMRQLLLLKSSAVEFKRLIHPRALIPVRYNKKSVSPEIISNILAFFLLYMIVFAFGTLVMAAIGLDFSTSIGSVIATLGNIGPGIGNVGPIHNYASIPDFGKWFLSFLMLLGRLELFTVLVILSPAFWRK